MLVHGRAKIVSASYLLYLNAIFFEKRDFVRHKMRFQVAVAECPYFLAIHPVEHALLAGVAPRPHVAILGQCHCVVLAEADVDYAEA